MVNISIIILYMYADRHIVYRWIGRCAQQANTSINEMETHDIALYNKCNFLNNVELYSRPSTSITTLSQIQGILFRGNKSPFSPWLILHIAFRNSNEHFHHGTFPRLINRFPFYQFLEFEYSHCKLKMHVVTIRNSYTSLVFLLYFNTHSNFPVMRILKYQFMTLEVFKVSNISFPSGVKI